VREADRPPSTPEGEAAMLLGRIGQGDVAAFRTLYDRVAAKLLGACLRILSERGEAEDALQEVFLTIWRRAAAFDPARGSANAWLLTLARNAAIDRLRARGKIAAAPFAAADDVADHAPLAWETIERTQTGQRLAACVELLERRDATLIHAAFFQGSTYPELAARDALPLGTVKSRIRRALLKLAECMA
jgi:RNA polymerase sigma-70 factor (ECF subfamily)